jgi:hypothetical protein
VRLERVVGVAALLFGVVVVDEKLAVLAVAAGLVLGDLDDGEPAAGTLDLVEDGIHLLERAVGRLGIEEVDHGHDDGVDDGKDEVRPVANVVEADGGDHDDLCGMLVDDVCKTMSSSNSP